MKVQKRQLNILICAVALVLPHSAWSDEVEVSESKKPARDIREVLTRSQFEESGLEKLSEEELKALSGHLYGWSKTAEKDALEAGKATNVAEEEAFGKEQVEDLQEEETPKFIESRMSGKFEGWNGRTIFDLQNGQVWRQIDSSRFVVDLMNPKVKIRKGWLGTYYLQVEGYNSSCKVSRIR